MSNNIESDPGPTSLAEGNAICRWATGNALAPILDRLEDLAFGQNELQGAIVAEPCLPDIRAPYSELLASPERKPHLAMLPGGVSPQNAFNMVCSDKFPIRDVAFELLLEGWGDRLRNFSEIAASMVIRSVKEVEDDAAFTLALRPEWHCMKHLIEDRRKLAEGLGSIFGICHPTTKGEGDFDIPIATVPFSGNDPERVFNFLRQAKEVCSRPVRFNLSMVSSVIYSPLATSV
ncbi:MAG TPA: hypothetical protein VL989_03475 [Candidatus Sulfotelmatobacter sp.]|nr:hypothetical protein [Candidatus Sulfotelmatobacter sp.]